MLVEGGKSSATGKFMTTWLKAKAQIRMETKSSNGVAHSRRVDSRYSLPTGRLTITWLSKRGGGGGVDRSLVEDWKSPSMGRLTMTL